MHCCWNLWNCQWQSISTEFEWVQSVCPYDSNYVRCLCLVFPGQTIAAIGKMHGLHDTFHAEEILCGGPPLAPVTTNTSKCSPSPLHLTVACGPFSPNDTLVFDALSDLEARVRERPPDVLILMGPLLDCGHPSVACGSVTDSFGRPVTFDQIYKEEIVPKLARLARACDNCRVQLIIVPSLQEVRFNYPLPQPPMTINALWEYVRAELPSSVRFVSNPATVELSDIRLLVSSTDALSSLNSTLEFKQGNSLLGRVDSCLEQMLRSRSLFPAAPSSIRIDSQNRAALDMEELPHVIVFPSISGKRFVKQISGRIFVNPGFMCDMSGSSSLADIVVNPPQSVDCAGDLFSRISAEVVKLWIKQLII